ncbi:MAG: TIGR04084 family radical SAM/SPASM domain-containing protein [Candidatus Nezhaarchaeales archaeon]
MLCYILTTGKCNLKCSYCGGSFPEHLVPSDVKYTINDLNDFLDNIEDLIITFYGGEPLLNAQWIMKVMSRVNAKHFVIQTNGLLIDKLPRDYWLQMDAILLSIDGIEQITDHHRGKGVYRKVIAAARKLRAMGYEGDLIARMTVTELSDIYRDAEHLLSLELFDHVHWQLNAVWNPNKSSFKSWLISSYIPKLNALIDLWASKALKGELLGLAPLKALLYAMIKGHSLGMPPCGAGWNALAINTNGDVLACPIAVDVKWARLGNIKSSTCKELLGKIKIGEPCIHCQYGNLCGGRCLYTYHERLWGDEGFKLLCLATQALIEKLYRIKPKIEKAIKNNVIKIDHLKYPAFLNSIEIIP